MKWALAVLWLIVVVGLLAVAVDVQEKRQLRAEMRAAGVETPEEIAAWKIERAKRLRRESVERRLAEEEEKREKVLQDRALRYCRDGGMAFVMSQKFVKRQLRSPSTAQFPSSPTMSSSLGECSFRIVAWVDAQNAFGAMIRNRYAADMTYSPRTDRWSAENIMVGE